jgi:hypothetical protein
MKIENLFYFTKYPRRVQSNSILCCYIQSSIQSENDLFYSLNEQLKFSVFGWNWNALHDSLCDFEGIKEINIVIIHDKLNLHEDVLSDYLLCLMRNALTWKKYSHEHRFFPVFSISDKSNILKILYSNELQTWFKVDSEHFQLTE